MNNLDDEVGARGDLDDGTAQDFLPLWRLTNEEYMAPHSSLRVYYYTIPKRVAVHWHEFYEMFFVVKGAGTHVLNGTTYPLTPGSFFLLTPADFHEIAARRGAILELYNVIFREDALEDAVHRLLFHEIMDYGTLYEGADFAAMAAEFGRLWTEANERKAGYQRMMQGSLERVLIELARRYLTRRGVAEPRPAVGRHAKVHQGLVYLHHHFREPLTLDRVAAHADLSPHYFSECFHKATGSSFQLYLRDLRLRFARSLLQVADMPVTEICYASGYATLSHFERAFKQKYGRSPRAYRRCG